ncbi:hypothetical protein [Streptomyces sp. NPDC059916]|uniref:hypothetical protein n=1 Tax=Streptomyces sp. NPDC059916 TaxID=3347001 RepID=UPI00369824F3
MNSPEPLSVEAPAAGAGQKGETRPLPEDLTSSALPAASTTYQLPWRSTAAPLREAWPSGSVSRRGTATGLRSSETAWYRVS